MIKLSFLNLFRKKTRTFLALLGIVIGVASILVLVSIVDGVFKEFNDVLSQFQGLMVMEQDSFDQPFSRLDVSWEQKLESIPGVKGAIPEIWYVPKKIDDKDAGIGGGGFSFTGVYGLDIQKQLSISSTGWVVDFEQGSVINPGESGAVLIGKKIADDYHKFVGSSLEIDGKKYRVKGIFEAESELIENVIVMNLEDARDLAGIPSDEVNTFTVGLVDPSRDDEIAKLMEFKYGDDLQVFSMSQSSDLLGGILGQFRLVVFFVAAISAVVASVGIMNTILMSIFDRIKEIGALKAVGWTNSNIVKMVMYESLALGVVGGIVGLMVGFGIDVFLNSQFGLPYSITPMLLLEAFSFAVLLGLIAGIYPAFRAAKLDPVEAMRY